MEPEVRVEGLLARVGSFTLSVGRLSLRGPGLAVVEGDNGSGKTVLVKSILGLVKPSRGRVYLCGLDVTGKPGVAGRCASYMPQNAPLMAAHYPLTPLELLEYSMRLRGHSFNRDEALRLLAELGLPGEDLARPMAELAPGERQKVFAARALLAPSKVVFLDEPFSAMDREGREALARMLLREARRRLVVLVAHSPEGLAGEVNARVRVEGGRVTAAW
ncbi:MAG: ATP-binding cassette domain-containing protein [Desulfurococcales archaeon]|nr:ATP-binding cassette domain-containing protein [Desulfurococcales archaeon]